MAEHVEDESGEAGRAFAEVAALTLLEAAEAQQAKAEDLLQGVKTAIRDLALERAELGKVVTAIEQSHQGYQEAIGQAIERFQVGLEEADQTVSGYVEAALERHQAVFVGALQEASERSIAEVQKVTEVAAKETLQSLRQAAQAAQSYVTSARQGVVAFRNRQWLMLGGAFLGGVTATVAGAAVILVLLDDQGRVARANQLEGRISVLQKQHDEMQQEIGVSRPVRPPARAAR